MMKYRHLRDYIQAKVLSDPKYSKARIHPGPEIPDGPSVKVILSRFGGPGLTLDGAFDDRAWQVRVVGGQGEKQFDLTEDLADDIDAALLSHQSGRIGPNWVTHIARMGGSPSVLMYDEAERVHFVCSYVGSVQLALPS